MSEYQYYEFQAIDRPPTREEMDELRVLSTRAEITATSFTNTYNWGDFKGDPDALMRDYFDAFLYVAFDVIDGTITGGFPADARDPHLWERDTAEVMIDPDGDGDNKDYYEIQINPQNIVFDSQFDDYNAPRGGPSGPFGHQAWSAGLTSAVELRGTIDDDSDEDRGYVVEAKIPWSSFAKAKANSCRSRSI